MKLAIIGTGYVGLPTSVGFAELGYNVIGIDREQGKIDTLRSGKITLYEDGLEELFNKNMTAGRISFTTSMADGIRGADIVFIAVGTPPHPVTKEADMKYIYSAATELADYISDYTVIVIKSTVPVGTGDMVEELIRKKRPNIECDVVSIPEFLREGFAVHDFFNPDRIVVGADTERAKDTIKKLYEPLLIKSKKTELLFISRRSSETVKYASNAFLAMKIHYINEMANLCEKADADILEVAKGMGLDSRIGRRFLNPGPGYGGSCFPKDTMAMAFMGRQNDVKLSLIEATIKGNDMRIADMANRIYSAVKDIKNAKVAALGLAFKGGTDDCRESPAIDIIKELINKNVQIHAYDPKAMLTAKALLDDKINYCEDCYSAIDGADVLVILTEWDEFKELDLDKVSALMKGRAILDFRNILNKESAIALGFDYRGVGR